MSRSLATCSLFSIVLAIGCNGWDDASATNRDGESDEQRRGRIATNIAGVDPTMGDAGRAAPVGGENEEEIGVDPNPAPSSPEPEVYTPKPVAGEGPPWLVLSNFRKQSQGIQTLGETYRVDYRWASGRPVESVSREFVVELTASNGLSQKQASKPVELDPKGGTATIGLQREFGVEPPTCFLAVKEGEKLTPISGRLKLGDATETAAKPDEVASGGAGENSPEPTVFEPPPVVEKPITVFNPGQPTEALPIQAPAGLPEKPSSDAGSAAYAVEDFVLKVAKADFEGLESVVADDATDELGQLRDGSIAVERANEIRRNLFQVQVVDARSLSNGSRRFVLRNTTGKFVNIDVRKRRGKYVVVEFEISGTPKTAGD